MLQPSCRAVADLAIHHPARPERLHPISERSPGLERPRTSPQQRSRTGKQSIKPTRSEVGLIPVTRCGERELRLLPFTSPARGVPEVAIGQYSAANNVECRRRAESRSLQPDGGHAMGYVEDPGEKYRAVAEACFPRPSTSHRPRPPNPCARRAASPGSWQSSACAGRPRT